MARSLSVVTLLVSFALSSVGRAQDVIQLHSVTIRPGDTVEVVYSKNFATCAHMRFSNASCGTRGQLTHAQNIFCRSGTNVVVTAARSRFAASFGPGSHVFMEHGNNGNVRSACVQVTCDGTYGAGCQGTNGTPVLVASEGCPQIGATLVVSLTSAPSGQSVLIAVGFDPADVPFLGCRLLVANIGVSVPLVSDASGAASFSFPIPPGVSGSTIRMQGLAIDGGPHVVVMSNGYEVTAR